MTGAASKDYTLLKRGDIYYARFRLPNGKRSTAKSTGQSSKSKAEKWCSEYLKAGDVVETANIKMIDFAVNFFSWDGDYIKGKRLYTKPLDRGSVEQGQSAGGISQKWTEQKQRLTNNYIIKYFENTKLANIKDIEVEDFTKWLYYDLKRSPQTVNHVLMCLSEILTEAKKRKYIQSIPEISKLAIVNSKPETLTPEEVKELFFNTQWGHNVAYYINLSMYLTGMRGGEAQGILLKDIHPGYIEINKTWDTEKLILTTKPKSGKNRVVAVSPTLSKILQELYNNNPYKEPDSFLFYSGNPDKPIDKKVMLKYLYRALNDIGIDHKARRIVGHSARHFWNTYCSNNNINKFLLQETIGQNDDRMTKHYYHARIEDQQQITSLQETFFPGDWTPVIKP